MRKCLGEFSDEKGVTHKKNPAEVSLGGVHKSGNDLLSRYSHYHWPQVLNGRVRNGNGCDPLDLSTGIEL